MHTPSAPTLLLLAGLGALAAACNPFGDMGGDGESWLEVSTWSPDLVAINDGLYIQLPEAGALARVTDDGKYSRVDLAGATPIRMVGTPDSEQVLVFARWPTCEDPSEDIVLVENCPEDKLGYDAELAIVADGRRTGAASIPAHMNALAFSPDGQTAVAYLDYDIGLDIEISGIVDLTEVVFVPLDGGDPVAVSIGFSPNNILFSADSAKAVVMSRSKVVVVDLATFSVLVEYPLTLDADQEVDPQDAVLSPDGSTALVSIQGSSLLYKLDLESYSIDIEDLDAAPADLAVSASTDETLIVYSGMARIDRLEHDRYELGEPVELDDPATAILLNDQAAVVYNDRGGSYDVYKLDLETNALTEYRVANPIQAMRLSPGGLYAVATLIPENTYSGGLDEYQDRNWGLAVMNLSGDEAVSLVLQSEPVGLALVEGDSTTYALLLLDGLDKLLKVDLAKPSQPVEIDLPAPPTGIGALPDGRFWVTHQSGLGLVSFLDPATDEPVSAGGFALAGLMDDAALPRRSNEEK